MPVLAAENARTDGNWELSQASLAVQVGDQFYSAGVTALDLVGTLTPGTLAWQLEVNAAHFAFVSAIQKYAQAMQHAANASQAYALALWHLWGGGGAGGGGNGGM